jgi:hypothetical protein
MGVGEVVARGVKFVRWDLDRLVEQVRSVCEVDERGCWIWRYGGYDREWYPEIMIKRRKKSVARWILEVTTGEIGEVARHRCDRIPCCNPDHLLWGTQADNVHDAFERGRRRPKAVYVARERRPETFACGERHGLAKLTEDKVRQIRARHAGGISAYRLAKEYGMSKGCIRQVVRRVTWQHVA